MFDFFISRSSKDDLPLVFCEELEKRGVKCWIAPRNIPPGMPYSSAIMEGITNSHNFLLFVSRNSVVSKDVLNEVENVYRTNKLIVPVFIENIPMSQDLAYYLNRVQWIDTFNGIDDAIKRLFEIKAVKFESIDKDKFEYYNTRSESSLLASPRLNREQFFNLIHPAPQDVPYDEDEEETSGFIMPVTHILDRSGQECMLRGKIEEGEIKTGDMVSVVSGEDYFQTKVQRVEDSGGSARPCHKGEDCGVVLECIKSKKDIRKDAVVIKNKQVSITKNVEVWAYIYSQEEGVPEVNLTVGASLRLRSRASSVPCTIESMSQNYAKNGNVVAMKLKLKKSLFLQERDVVMLLEPTTAMFQAPKILAPAIVTKLS